MATVRQDALAALAEGFGGDLLAPDEPGYDEARALFNSMIDRRPALIARCSGTADVIAGVLYAREHDMPIAVRCGGHSVAGHSAGDESALVVDLSPMKGVRVDPDAHVARANGGVQWGEYDRETQAFGLATPGGRVTTTGVGGFTLGGGYGWISPKYGLTCDSLLSADLVMADGTLVTASETQNEDLFWALRGGGGNFGVVTSFEFRLHSVGPEVLGGLLIWDRARAHDAVAAYREVVDAPPHELATALISMPAAPPEEFVPEDLHDKPALAVVVSYCGDPGEGQAVVQPLLDAAPDAVALAPMPYRTLQALLDPIAPPGFRNYWRGEHLTGMSDGFAETFLSCPIEDLHPLSGLILFQHGGAVADIPDDATAAANREAAFMIHPFGMWEDAADDARHIGWVRDVSAAMQPFTTGGVYLNFETASDRVRAGFGDEKYARLVDIKRKYDPDNVFRFNQNISPE